MPYLCPKGIDFGAKPSVPFCPPTLPPYLGVPNEHTESQGIPPGEGCLGLGRNSLLWF